MDKVIQIANICKDMCNVPNPIPGRIYYAKGCAPALNTCVCGGVEKTDVFMDKTKRYIIGQSHDSRGNLANYHVVALWPCIVAGCSKNRLTRILWIEPKR